MYVLNALSFSFEYDFNYQLSIENDQTETMRTEFQLHKYYVGTHTAITAAARGSLQPY